MSHTSTTASAIRPGDLLHRVARAPLSNVFADVIDAVVLDVYPNPKYPTHLTVVLEPKAPATRHHLNLTPDRKVTLG